MGHSDFGTELEAVRRRLSDLQRQSAEDPHRLVHLLPEIFEQLQAEFEELRIAGEDLCREHQERTTNLTAADKRLQDEIIERTRVEEALKESERFLRGVFDAIQDGVSVLDRDLNVVSVNQWMEKTYTGRMPLLGRKCYDVYQDRESPCPWCPSLRTLRDADLHSEIVPYPSEENPTGWIELSAFPLRDADGRVIGVIEYVKDITERRQAEKALQESEEQFRQIAENVDEVFFLSDARDHSAIYINPAYEKIWGRPVEEVYANAQSWQEAIHPDDRARAKAVVERHGRGRKEFSNEYRIVRPDGAIRWVHDHVYPVRNESGQVYRIIGVTADITERRRAEELARQRQAELAHVSRVNTIGEMASGIAHELNQPLAAIVNYTNGCLRRLRSGATDADELVKAIEQIAGQAERAGEIIRRLGNFVRRRESKRSSVNINEAVREVLRLMQPDAGQHGITVRVNLSEGLKPAPADKVQIQQVILNLLRNGIEAMENGDTERRVLTVETSAADGNAVKVTIRDTGCGLTDEVLDKLFDPFFTTKPHGMGVGLSISRTIIDAHGGRLWATRNADRGATFTFTLPSPSGGDDHAS